MREWRVCTSDTWHGNTRCQVNLIRNSPPDKISSVEMRRKERKERKNDAKKRKENFQCSLVREQCEVQWLTSELVCATTGRCPHIPVHFTPRGRVGA